MFLIHIWSLKKIDEVIGTLVTDAAHGPLLLLWSAVRMNYCDQEAIPQTRKLGMKSRQLEVYQYIYNLLTSEPFGYESSVS